MEEFKQTQVILISKNENDCAKYTETIQENGQFLHFLNSSLFTYSLCGQHTKNFYFSSHD